ncbi:hypothetical protein C8F01DRAFT_1186241 [Mycena amicta]|nr:hypothetical protein C8F01DRAFT_1186241 [Mycena amicta]
MTTTLGPLPTDTYDDERRHYLVERNVTLPPTATSGVPASNAITQSHSHRPTPTKHFQSDKQRNTPVGLIWGVSIAVVVAIVALFLVRFLFIRRARKRAVAAGVGVVQGKRASMAKGKGSLESGASVKMEYPLPPRPPPAHGYPHQHHADVEQQLPATERDAVELRSYDYPPMPAPPSSSPPPTLSPSPYTQTQQSGWSAPFSSQAATSTPFVQGYAQPAPGPRSSPEERQAYLSAEIRSVQTQLERNGNGNGNGEERERKALRARIHELEDRQQSAWALGLE